MSTYLFPEKVGPGDWRLTMKCLKCPGFSVGFPQGDMVTDGLVRSTRLFTRPRDTW